MNYQDEKINERESPNQNHKEIPGNPSTATSSKLKLNDRSKIKELKILSEADWKFWIENGYVVIKNAVPKEQAAKTADFLWEFEEKTETDQSSWYAPPRAEMEIKELAGTGMVFCKIILVLYTITNIPSPPAVVSPFLLQLIPIT